LIEKKTIEFLAKALPALQRDHEAMLELAGHLPANQLLNPTSSASPLGYSHLESLNRRLRRDLEDADLPELRKREAPPKTVPKRRRKRSSLSTLVSERAIVGTTVAELRPQASLVVSSPHGSMEQDQVKRQSHFVQRAAHIEDQRQEFVITTKNNHQLPKTSVTRTPANQLGQPGSGSETSLGNLEAESGGSRKLGAVAKADTATLGSVVREEDEKGPKYASNLENNSTLFYSLGETGEIHSEAPKQPRDQAPKLDSARGANTAQQSKDVANSTIISTSSRPSRLANNSSV